MNRFNGDSVVGGAGAPNVTATPAAGTPAAADTPARGGGLFLAAVLVAAVAGVAWLYTGGAKKAARQFVMGGQGGRKQAAKSSPLDDAEVVKVSDGSAAETGAPDAGGEGGEE